MSTPYQPLNDAQKQVTFHDDPVNHSGILPSGEGNYADPNQVIRNDDIFEDRTKPILHGSPSKHPNNPTATPPATFQPSGLDFTNITSSGIVNNPEAADQSKMGFGGNALSNATRFPPQTFDSGRYIHYYRPATPGLLPDGNGAITYDPTAGITATTESGIFYPYPETFGDTEDA